MCRKTPEIFKEAVGAAGRCGVITTGGSSIAEESFLKGLWEQINIAGTRGNDTGRNIHQKNPAERHPHVRRNQRHYPAR
jgi:fructose-bisphosphate aldolase/6-deoxy-5-ketofructose 1-phosphate synthase